MDGNLKLLLGILWRFIFKYQISGNLHKPRLSRPNSVSDETTHTHREMSASKMLLAWFQASLPQFKISNFSQDWSDGVKLSALVNYCKPGLIPNWDQKDPQNAFENIHNAISLAHEHFTIPEVLHAEDLAVEKPDRQAVMTYLSYFCCPGSPGEKVLMEWIELVIPEVKITNFTSDWKDGESLCALVSAFAPSAISREALEGKSNVEITRAAMEAAKEQFNISCLSSPEEFTSPTCDQLSVMVYLSHFRFIKEERRKLPYLSALGSGITGTEIGTEAQLQIEGETLDGSIVEVRVQSPDLGEVEVHEIPVRSGTPGFQYRPTVPGTYTVEVKYSGEHVKGSPYKVRHLPPLDSVTGGRGLHRACVGRQAEFTVDVSNLGEGVLNFRILDPDDMPLDNVHMTEATAEYTVTYTPWRSGDHKIQLEWDCTPVTDEIDVDESFNTLECTYTVSVFDISKCVVRGSGLSEAIIGELASFEIETSAVGKGSLSTILTGPGNPDMKLVSIDDDVYAYEYTPEMEGELQFDIMWEMVPIPGSPFKLTPSPRTPAMECVMKEAEMKSIEAEEQKQGRMEAETKVQMLSRKCTQMEGEIETLKAKIRFEQAKHTKALEEQRKAEAERDKAGIEMVKPLHSQCVIVDSAQHSEMKTVRAFKEHDEAERPKKPFFNTLDVEVKQMMQHMKEQAIKAIHEREIEKIKIENWQLKKRAKAAEKKVTLLEEGGKKFIKQAIAAEVLELKNTKVIQQSLKLESTIDSIAEKMVQVTNEEQHIDLEGCGLSLHIPPDSLPGDCSQFTLNMAVSRVQDYKLPAEDGILVSPVYSFCHNLGDRKLLKPATLKMQHCVARCNQLYIVQSNDMSSPYQFHILQDGKFNDGDSYGSIELDHFCSFGVYLQWYCASLIWTIKFCAVLYYTNIKNHSFQFNLYVIPQLDAIVKVCTTIIFV